MIKDKKCKGTGKAKGFNSCGKMVIAKTRKYGLCPECFRHFLFSDLGIETKEKFFASIHNKIMTEKKKQKKTIDKKQKIESKSIAVLIQEAKQPFQKLIRIRDHRKDCICCNNILPYTLGDYDAGHYFKAEIYTGLIFHPDNVHGQKKYCNQYLHGNESGYTTGLIKRIGWARFQKINSIKENLKFYKWDRYKLIELKDHYKKELAMVEKGEKDISEVDFNIGIIK